MDKQAQIIVKGKVQGVFFRDFTQENATKLRLTGWVRNLSDGNVEVLVEGEEGEILKLIERLKIGPTTAQVKEVTVKWRTSSNAFNNFSIRW